MTDESRGFILVYAVLTLGVLIFSAARVVVVYISCLNSSAAVHTRLFSAMIRAPMRFFEVNSVGRILNRFSNDIGIMDEHLPTILYLAIIVRIYDRSKS